MQNKPMIKSIAMNKRANEMWSHITNHVDFKNKSVADFGCGYGDFMWRAVDAGANVAVGFDSEKKFDILPEFSKRIKFVKDDLEDLAQKDLPKKFHIGLCFSVLPYLEQYFLFLVWMSKHVRTGLVEVQYLPEPYNIDISNDSEMRTLLLLTDFTFVMPIGKTFIPAHNTYRTIWMCT